MDGTFSFRMKIKFGKHLWRSHRGKSNGPTQKPRSDYPLQTAYARHEALFIYGMVQRNQMTAAAARELIGISAGQRDVLTSLFPRAAVVRFLEFRREVLVEFDKLSGGAYGKHKKKPVEDLGGAAVLGPPVRRMFAKAAHD